MIVQELRALSNLKSDFKERSGRQSQLFDSFSAIDLLLCKTGPGHNTVTAYDTAWVARLGRLLPAVAEQAQRWLRVNQLSDGGWGMERPIYHHDRVLCTLSAVIALHKNNDSQDSSRIALGIASLSHHLERLNDDLAGPTAGFELLLPALVEEALAAGLTLQIDESLLYEMRQARQHKLALMPLSGISREVTMAFSAELAGVDGIDILDIENLLEQNGSVALSPSATAYYLLNINPDDQKALNYIEDVAQSGAPNFAPFDVYEKAWVLWNLIQCGYGSYPEVEQRMTPILNSLFASWESGKGIGFSQSFSPRDADDSAVVFEVLSFFGYKLPLKDLLYYEEADHFRCFDLETHPSTGANIHMLGALRCAGLSKFDEPVEKILKFLRGSRIDGCQWADKWHISPYYITSHAIIALAHFDFELGNDSVHWIIESQQPDGSWGFQFSTAEETAYCLQALVKWREKGYFVPLGTIQNGYRWLKQHLHDPIPPLWTAKCLYSPTLVVEAAILSTLLMVEEAGLESTESAEERYLFLR
ncbi:MAG: cyclase [Anaerolineae bacterium]